MKAEIIEKVRERHEKEEKAAEEGKCQYCGKSIGTEMTHCLDCRVRAFGFSGSFYEDIMIAMDQMFETEDYVEIKSTDTSITATGGGVRLKYFIDSDGTTKKVVEENLGVNRDTFISIVREAAAKFAEKSNSK